jgi:drug/metabolite transporter (DMT)-like permease
MSSSTIRIAAESAAATAHPVVEPVEAEVVVLRPAEQANVGLGLLYGVVAAVSFGLMAFLVHFLGQTLPSQEILFGRAVGALTLLMATGGWTLLPLIVRPVSMPLWTRAVAGAISAGIYFINLSTVGAATATLLIDLSLVFVVLIAAVFFKEMLTRREFVAFALVMAGNAALNLPGPGGHAAISAETLWLGILGALLAAISYTSLRQISQKFPVAAILLTFNIGLLAWSLVSRCEGWRLPHGWDWALLIGVVVSGYMGQLWMTKSFIHLKASVAGILALSAIFWGGLLDFIFLGVQPAPLELVSYAVILGGIWILKTREAE